MTGKRCDAFEMRVPNKLTGWSEYLSLKTSLQELMRKTFNSFIASETKETEFTITHFTNSV